MIQELRSMLVDVLETRAYAVYRVITAMTRYSRRRGICDCGYWSRPTPW